MNQDTNVAEKVSDDPAGDALRSKIYDERLAERKSIERDRDPEHISSVYLHIYNSGATFDFLDSGHGPQIKISSGAFGNIEHTFAVRTNMDGLKALRDALDKAIAYKDYTESYGDQRPGNRR